MIEIIEQLKHVIPTIDPFCKKGNKVFKSYIFLKHTEHKRITESEQFVNFTQRQTDLKVKKESCEMPTGTMGYKLFWNQSHQQSNQFFKIILTNQICFKILSSSQKFSFQYSRAEWFGFWDTTGPWLVRF